MSDIQKIEHLTKRCSDLLSDMKRHERESQKNKKRGDQLQKDKDNTRSELNKTTSLKEKLEKLCRELQRENNKLKVCPLPSLSPCCFPDEGLDQSENKTLSDTQARSQHAWDERYAGLMRRVDDYQEEKDNPRKQVVDMEMDELLVAPTPRNPEDSLTSPSFRQRFKSLIEQYELRETHFHSQMRTKELEVQYNIARFEREKAKHDSELARSRQLNSQVQTFSKTEGELRQQLNVYVDKFKQVCRICPTDQAGRLTLAKVEDTLNNSNELFLTFRKEMEDMSKKTKRLERENETLKRKHEQVNNNIIKMAEERTKNMAEIQALKKKHEKLTGIIKQMQQQGRGIPQGAAGQPNAGYGEAEGDLEAEDDSDYAEEYDEDEDEEVSDDGEEYDDETEDELQQPSQPQAYGPERPPPATVVAAHTNGHR